MNEPGEAIRAAVRKLLPPEIEVTSNPYWNQIPPKVLYVGTNSFRPKTKEQLLSAMWHTDRHHNYSCEIADPNAYDGLIRALIDDDFPIRDPMNETLEAIGHGLIELLPGYELRPPQEFPYSYTDGPQIQLWNPKPSEPTIHLHLYDLKNQGPTLEASWKKRNKKPSQYWSKLPITALWSKSLADPDSIDGLIRALMADGYPIQESAPAKL
jgi:hypothetical protein